MASNRGPVEFYQHATGRLTTRRGSGGVVTALAALAQNLPITWIAATMSAADREAFPDANTPARTVRLGRQPLRVRYVNVPQDVYTLHYDRISNELLWFLQHYLWDTANTPNFTEEYYHAWEQGYRQVNYAIAQAIVDEALASAPQTPAGRRRPNDGSDVIILLQDYHLYLAPRFIRERLPRATIQQFVHIPWPSVRYWQFLPERFLIEIMEGVAANDVLGFQTPLDARNFLSCCHALLPGSRIDVDQGRLIRRRHKLLARAYPITIDADEVQKTLRSAAGRAGAHEIAELAQDEQPVIVRVDRLEPTKNIVRGLLAYEELLRHHPELHGQVQHLVFLVPSRQSLDTYQKYDKAVRRHIRRINRHYGTPGWKPIQAFFENNRARALAAMRRADVLLVNPIMDGMNLVAKEGAIANDRDGVIILSRTAGAFQEMKQAVLAVTPTDIEETADQLYEAIVMSSAERRHLAALAREIVERSSLTRWIHDQVADAARVHGTPTTSPHHTLSRAG